MLNIGPKPVKKILHQKRFYERSALLQTRIEGAAQKEIRFYERNEISLERFNTRILKNGKFDSERIKHYQRVLCNGVLRPVKRTFETDRCKNRNTSKKSILFEHN